MRFSVLHPGTCRWLSALAVGIGMTLLQVPSAVPSDWSQWRGPNRNNVAAPGQNVPTDWSQPDSLIWRTEVPGRGHSSPTIVGNLIVLTSADEQQQIQGVVAFDRSSGQQLWLTPVSRGGFPPTHAKNTHASATVASDGERFFAVFNHHEKLEAVALDREGNIVWQQDVGRFVPQLYKYGYAASPTVVGDTLVISGESDTGSWLKALSTRDGSVAWQQQRPNGLNWSSPIVADVAGRRQLLLSGSNMLAAYDPETGQELWTTRCLTAATCGTAVWEGDVAFASGGYPKAETVAVLADGSGKILWTNNVKCYEQSMLVHQGSLYAFSDNGIAYCWNAATGREMWKQRLRGPVSVSPVLVDDVIIAANESGTFYLFKATPDGYQQVAVNQLGTESFATPAVVDNQIFVRVGDSSGGRRQEYLCCFGNR